MTDQQQPETTKKATITLDAVGDHAFPVHQISLNAMSSETSGHGYRLLGPKYTGRSRNLRTAELDQRDADEIRAILDEVFPPAVPSTDTTAPRPGDRVEITAVQSYEITWDDAADVIVGLTGVLVAVDERGVKDNAETGRLDSAPYEVRIDRDAPFDAGEIRFVSGVRRVATEEQAVALH